MTRAKLIHNIAIVFRALIFIVNNQCDRSACCLTFKNTRQNLHFIIFAALSGMTRCARLSSIQVILQIGFG